MRQDARYGEFKKGDFVVTNERLQNETDELTGEKFDIPAGTIGKFIRYCETGHLVDVRIGSMVIETIFQCLNPCVKADNAMLPEEEELLEKLVMSFTIRKFHNRNKDFETAELCGFLPEFLTGCLKTSYRDTLKKLEKMSVDDERMNALLTALIAVYDSSLKAEVPPFSER
jgi:hypothetical protein